VIAFPALFAPIVVIILIELEATLPVADISEWLLSICANLCLTTESWLRCAMEGLCVGVVGRDESAAVRFALMVSSKIEVEGGGWYEAERRELDSDSLEEK